MIIGHTEKEGCSTVVLVASLMVSKGPLDTRVLVENASYRDTGSVGSVPTEKFENCDTAHKLIWSINGKAAFVTVGR